MMCVTCNKYCNCRIKPTLLTNEWMMCQWLQPIHLLQLHRHDLIDIFTDEVSNPFTYFMSPWLNNLLFSRTISCFQIYSEYQFEIKTCLMTLHHNFNSRESLATGRGSHPPTPPSTPAEGSFFPDAPIQFDIITPCKEAAKNFPESKEGPPK